MSKAARLFPVVLAAGLVLSPAARAQSGASADDIAALRRELRALAQHDQQQINALQRQVHALSAALAKSRRASRTAAARPAPAEPQMTRSAETMAPTAEVTGLPVEPKPEAGAPPHARMPRLPPRMFNLPGRSAVAPYTASGPGVPGVSPDTPATPVSGGGNRVTLSLSGQIDRALLWGDDGKNSNLRQVDNNNSSTRFRIVGEAEPIAGTVAGMNLETEIKPNSSGNTTLTQDLPQPASASTFVIRQAEVYGGNARFGEVRLGFGSTASYLTAETDLSGTSVVTYESVADFDGGFAFRQKGAAMVPGGAHGALVPSAAASYGPAVGSVFNFFDGLGRDDRIRYDTPEWNGFQLATSAVDGGAVDLAGRFARRYEDFRIAGGIGMAFATSRSHTAPGSYGYAGVPAGAGGISIGGPNGAPSAPATADVSANGSNQFDGSVSILLKSGLNLTLAGGVRDPSYRDPTGHSLSPNLIYAKFGYQHRFFSIGLTAFSVDFGENDDLIFAGDKARAYGIAAVQNIDQFGTELFVGGRYETLDRSLAAYHPIFAVMSGARVRF
jgi:hypothetical protein